MMKGLLIYYVDRRIDVDGNSNIIICNYITYNVVSMRREFAETYDISASEPISFGSRYRDYLFQNVSL